MTNRTLALSDEVYDYLLAHGTREPELLRRLRDETAQLPMAQMQIGADQGAFMALLVRLIGARRCLEIGTFTGYSSLVVAMALPEDGHLVCCDVSEEWTAVARRYWAEAGLAGRIELRLGPADETLDRMLSGGDEGSYDFAFIDADKPGYDGYYERCLRLVRPGGLIAIDNVLQSGKVADPTADDESVRVIRALNAKIAGDERVDVVMLPIADGLTLARVR